MDKSRVFLIFLLSFLGGVFGASFFKVTNFVAELLILLSIILIAVFWRRNSRLRKRFGGQAKIITLISFMMIFLVIGVLIFNHNSEVDKKLKNFNDTNFKPVLRGYIASDPEFLLAKQRFILRVKQIEVPKYRIGLNENILVTADLYPQYRYGQFLEVQASLRAPQKFLTPDGDEFDYPVYLAKDNIFSLAYWPEIKIVDLKCSPPQIFSKNLGGQGFKNLECLKVVLFEKIFGLKNLFKSSVNKVLSEPSASLVNGLLLGSRENISPELKEAFNKTGTSHILAISGWNITIIGGLISWLLLFFLKRQKAFWLAVLGIILFTILTGAAASVVRAAIMGILVLLAQSQGRFHHSINAIVFAGALMSLFNPNILRFDLGFQLSFFATLGIIFISPYLKNKSASWRIKLPEFLKIKENLVMTLSAQAAVLPLLIYNFHNFSFLSVPANILILPAIPFIMLFGFLAGVAGFLSTTLGQIFALAALFLSKYVIFVVKIFS